MTQVVSVRPSLYPNVSAMLPPPFQIVKRKVWRTAPTHTICASLPIRPALALMTHLRLTPGTLWPAIQRQTEHALECGALQPIETVQAVIESAGVHFLIRRVSSLTRKEQQQEEARKLQKAERPRINPFLPYEPDLFVADISETHLTLLNKFNVIDHHLLIVTRKFVPQESLLDLADFDALLACMMEFDSIGFYNAGSAAGASQPHKHLQIVPLPLGESQPDVPVEALLENARFDGATGDVPGFAFRHAVARVDLSRGAGAALETYRALLAAANGGETAPYNLLVTRRWMLLVPRSQERVEGVAVNSLGFAGSLFVRDAAQMQVLEQLGPMTALQRVALPRP
jgi:sulfate adenylyltransferase (ADP) / ATP adenylyltransferase